MYRCALTLRGEKAPDVVVEHHHLAEFPEGEDHRDSPARQYVALWHAPIVVVTAVQFFETLAAASTAGLRKLHQLPGSAIFIDEAHAALPAKLWPQAFRWLVQLSKDWGCHCVLASGSLPEIWKMEEFIEVKTPVVVPAFLPIRPVRAAHAEGLFRIIQSIPSPKAPLVRTLPVPGDIARHTAAAMPSPIASHDYRMIEKAILEQHLTDDLATAAASRSLSNATSLLP